MFFTNFVVCPPGCGESVTNFWDWDAREAQLRCPDGVSGEYKKMKCWEGP
jgi:hypothetical protein